MNDSDHSYDRRTILRLAGAAGVAGLAGCSDDGGGEGTGTAGGGGGGGNMASSVEVWGWDVAARSLDLTDDPYVEQADGNPTVDVQEFGRSDMKDRYQSRLLSGSGAPAVAMMESVDAPNWVDTGGLRDISGMISDEVRNGFVEGKWGPLEQDGATYALPWDIGPVGTFIRKDVYNEHGLSWEDIETWDDFIEEGQKLPDDIAMINIPSDDYDGIWRMMYRMLGGEAFTDDGAVNVASEDSVRVAQLLKDLRDAGITSSVASWSSEWFSRFGDGTIASLNGGAWMEGTLKSELGDTSGNWHVILPPAFEQGGNRATNWGGSNLVIADQVSDAKANRGYDYMEFSLASTEQQIRMYQEFGIFPAWEPAYESDAFDEGSDFLDGQAAGRLFADIAPDIPSYNLTTDTPEITEAINTHFGDMMSGDISPEEACQRAAEQVVDRTDREMA